jgi:hypothetical protein
VLHALYERAHLSPTNVSIAAKVISAIGRLNQVRAGSMSPIISFDEQENSANALHILLVECDRPQQDMAIVKIIMKEIEHIAEQYPQVSVSHV